MIYFYISTSIIWFLLIFMLNVNVWRPRDIHSLCENIFYDINEKNNLNTTGTLLYSSCILQHVSHSTTMFNSQIKWYVLGLSKNL